MVGKSVIEKVKSNKGITIIFSLFVLLICMVVGSVVLTAGTAASGRLKQTAETDRQYYSLLSAVELLKSEYDGENTVIKKSKTTTVSTTYMLTKTIADDGTLITQKTEPENKKIADVYTSRYEEDSIFYSLAREYVLGDSEMSETGYESTALPVTGSDIERSYTLQIDNMSDETDQQDIPAELLKVSVKIKMEKDGSVVCVLSSGSDSDTYQITARFDCDFSQENVTGILPDFLDADGEEYDGKANPYSVSKYTDEKKDQCDVTEIRQTVDEKIYSFTWRFAGMEIS